MITDHLGRPVAVGDLTPAMMLDILRSTTCYCGEYKKAMMSHCRRCYHALPPEMKQALYRRFGSGYEEAYRASLEELAHE